MTRRAVALLGGLSLTGSCYEIDEIGPVTIFSFARGPLIAVIVACVIGGLAGAWLTRRPARRKNGLGYIALAAFIGAGIAPSAWRDRIIITPAVTEHTTGPWFLPQDHRIRYANVDFISIQNVQSFRSTHRTWFVHMKHGEIDTISMGDLGDNNEDVILSKLRAYGVRFR
jgi:hypothetical protein